MTSVGAPRRTRRILRRSVDVVVAGVALLLTLPVALLAALVIKFTSPRGPVLVHEVRAGADGGRFDLLKLRTTTVSTSVDSPGSPESAADERVTAVGRVLRTCSIDELPQLWNVVRGDLSIVGPPPSDPMATTTDSDGERPGDRPGGVPPGLTGIWRASGRRGAPGAPPP